MLTDYNLDAHLQSAYKAFIGKTVRPVIGLTANFSGEDATLRERYYQQIVDAGGTPLIIPPVADEMVILSTLDQIDGLLLTGGADYSRSCSSPALPSTGKFPCWESAVAYRHWPWHWKERSHKTSRNSRRRTKMSASATHKTLTGQNRHTSSTSPLAPPYIIYI